MYLFLITLVIIPFTVAVFPPQISNLMDINIQPCDDFYKYACGGWLKNHSLNESVSYIQTGSLGTESRAQNQEAILAILKQNHPILSEFWESCIDLDTINHLGNQPLQKDLNDVMNAKSKDELIWLASGLSRVENAVIADVKIVSDSEDTTKYAIHLELPKLTLPLHEYSYYSFFTIKMEYQEYIHNLMKLAGFSKKYDQSLADIVIDIEKKLVSFQRNSEDLEPYSIFELQRKWPRTMVSFLKSTGIYGKVQMVSDDVKIYAPTKYFHSLEKFIESIELEELRVYIAFVMIERRTSWLGTDFSQIQSDLFRLGTLSREKFCIDRVVTYLPDLIGKYYYDKSFDNQRKKNAREVINLIQDAMENRISLSTWLKPESKRAAVAKLKNMVTLLGESPVSHSYPSTLSRHDYPGNMHILLSHQFEQNLKKIRQRVNREEWESSSATLNAFYNPGKNSMWLPAAIFHTPSFGQRNLHPALKFGSIGFIIGHELTHAFDTSGQKYDENGNWVELWDAKSSQIYDERIKCWEDQFSSYEVHGEKGLIGVVDGEMTLQENIADHGGVALAWDAYRKYMSHFKSKTNDANTQEEDQLFFLAYAQDHCYKAHEDFTKHLLNEDTHAPDEWRVKGVVMNSEEFAKAFQCKTNTPMNPPVKCKLW